MTQQAAMEDARAEGYEASLRRLMAVAAGDIGTNFSLLPREAQAILDAVAVAVRERDQAQEALRQLLTYSTSSEYGADGIAAVAIARAALAGGETVNQKPKGHTA